MSVKHKEELKFQTCPTLFETEQGEPLCFYLRPGPVKRELMPLIKASGGLLCNIQKPGAILLKDPEEPASVTDTTAHWYVSTKYIHDCIKKNKRLNIEDYRLNPESTNSGKRKRKSRIGSPGISFGRTAYTPEEDEAILNFVSKRLREIGGNRLWKEMSKKNVTVHSWQSMKYRYRVQLSHRLSEYTHRQKGNKEQNSEQKDAEEESEERTSPQMTPAKMEDSDSSLGMDLTQITPSSDSLDEQEEGPQTECNDDEECGPMETSKSEIDATPEQQQPAQPQPAVSEKEVQTEAAAEDKPVLNVSDKSPQSSASRPITRQQTELENMPYTKRLRSSGTPPDSLYRVRQRQSSKTKSFSSPKSDSREAQAPPKKVRKKLEVAVAEQTEEETGQSGPSVAEQTEEETGQSGPSVDEQTEETEQSGPSVAEQTEEETGQSGPSVAPPLQTDEAPCPASQPAEKKREKRKLGILEMATKEFEDDSESESDGPYETPGPSTSIEAIIGTSSDPDLSTLPSKNQQQDHGQIETGDPEPAAANTAANTANKTTATRTTAATTAAAASTSAAVPEPPTGGAPPIEEVTSRAHLFIFERESQELEEDCQPSSSAAAQTNSNTDVKAPSLTQDQLEEDVQLLRAMMKETSQDLVSVSRAILRASGDLILARWLLLNPASFSGPVWTRTEDQSLCSGDAAARRELLDKYGEEGVAKRLLFLELDR